MIRLSQSFVRAAASGELGLAITGASSWLGQATLAMLAHEGALTSHIRLRLFGSAARPVRVVDRVFAIEPLSDAAPLDDGAWLLLHFAFLGKERTGDLDLTAFLAGNDTILADTMSIASAARDLRFVFASSGAAHTPDRENNPYGWCKAAHEARIAAWCEERGAPLVMPRIFNIGGPFANKLDSYALSSMILSAARTGAITIRASRPTFRSYVHIEELLAVLCNAALTQPPGAPKCFDTAGDEVVEMGMLAEHISDVLGGGIRITRESCDGTPDVYSGDGTTYRALLADSGVTPLQAIIADQAAFLDVSTTDRRIA